MRTLLLFRRLVFAQVLLGIGAFCIVEENPGILLVAGALGALSWYVVEGPAGRPLPRFVINLGSMAAVAWLMLDLFRHGGDIVIAMGHFTMWLQVILLYSEKSNRDYGQILVLSLLQMVGASILSGTSFLFALLLAGYCFLALFTVLLFQLKATSDQVRSANSGAAPRGVRVGRPKAVACPGQRWHFRFTALSVGLAAAAISVLVFLVMPRNESYRGKDLAGLGRSRVGFNTEVRMKGAAGGGEHGPPVLTMQLSMDGAAIGSDERSWLLRGVALDTYDRFQHVWKRSYTRNATDVTVDLTRGGRKLVSSSPTSVPLEAEVTLRSTRDQILFSMLPITWMESQNLSTVQFNPDDQRLAAKDALTGPVVYRFRTRLGHGGDLTEEYRETLLEDEARTGRGVRERSGSRQRAARGSRFRHRGGNARAWVVETERVRGYVQRIMEAAGLSRDPSARSAPDDARIVRLLADHLRSGYRYTLENAPVDVEQDPVVNFLFDRREGHCELFAAGFVAMARSIGIPARVVTGFRVSDYNRLGGFYVVRSSDAHAWAEARVPGRGWITVDATPPAEVAAEHADPRRWYSPAHDFYEWIETAWIRGVVAYNDESRKQMIGQVNETVREETGGWEWVKRAVEWVKGLKDRFVFDRLTLGLVVVILVFIAVGIASLVRTIVVRRRRLTALQLARLPRAQRRMLARQLRFYLAMLDMLERHGYVRPLWQSPFGFAQDLTEAEPGRMQPVVALTEQFYEIRFGHRDLDPDRKRAVREGLSELEDNLIEKKRRRD